MSEINPNLIGNISFSKITELPIMIKKFTLTRSSTSNDYSIRFTDYGVRQTDSFLMFLNESIGNCTGVWAMASCSWNYNRQDFNGAKAVSLASVENYNSPRTTLSVTINSGSGYVTISGGKDLSLEVTLIGAN